MTERRPGDDEEEKRPPAAEEADADPEPGEDEESLADTEGELQGFMGSEGAKDSKQLHLSEERARKEKG